MQAQHFDPAIYLKIGYDELVVYSANLLSLQGQEITFENLVASCFLNFPERFALHNYPQWPDASVVNKSWLRCRTDKSYLVGTVKDSFRLTSKGLDAVARIERILTGKVKTAGQGRRRLTETKTREGTFLRELEKSISFRRFQEKGSLGGISDFDICDMLLCTLDSSPATRTANLEFLIKAASQYDRDDILRFFAEVRTTFPHLFRGRQVDGMMSSGPRR
jgi:hypothetical protein